MARYFFDVEDGSSYPDSEGSVFDDLNAVRQEALTRTVSLLAERKAEFWRGHSWKMIVSDDHRRVLFTLNFMAVNSPTTDGYGTRLSER